MDTDELLPLIFVNVVFDLIAYLSGGLLLAIITFLVVSYITLFIIRYFKYGRRIGKYKLAPFACYIFDDKGLLASFKGTDWEVIDEPTELISAKVRYKEYDSKSKSFKKDEVETEIDYLKIYKNVLQKFLTRLIPDPANPGEGYSGELTLDDLIKNYREPELYNKYKQLSLEDKKKLVEFMRAALASQLGLEPLPKLYQIASLSNGVFIYWFANGQPAEYYTYPSKQLFKKWKIVPWIRGFPVVEMWGVEIKGKREIRGKLLRCLICMPIQDERYRKEKSLNIKRYTIIASALTNYTSKILDILPYIDSIELLRKERDKYKEEVEVYRQGIMQIYADIGVVANSWFSAMRLLSKVSGAVSTMPTIPKEIKDELQELLPKIEKGKSRFERIKAVLSKLKGKEEEEEEEVKPPPETVTPSASPGEEA